MNKLIKQFVNRDIDEHLIDAEIFDGTTLVAAGFARLFFSEAGNATQVELFAEAKQDVNVLVGPIWATSGSFDFHARTLNGEMLHSRMRNLECSSYKTGANFRIWRFGPAKFDISPFDLPISDEEVVTMGSRLYAAVSPITQSIFNLKTKSTSIGIVESTSGTTDWTELQIDQTKYRLGMADGHSSKLFIDTDDSLSFEQLNKRLQSFLQAVSLLLGGTVEAYGTEARQGKKLATLLDEVARRRNPHTFNLPLVHFSFNGKENLFFLETATKYFFDNPDSPVFEYFDEFWGSELLSWPNRQRTLGTVVEGLANYILDQVVVRDDKTAWKEFNAGKKRFKTCRSALLALMAKSDLSKTNSDEFKRLSNIVTDCSPRVARDTIRLAGELIGVKITEDELSSWSNMRNPAAHGRNKTSLTPQEERDNLFHSVSILHKLTLRLIGWTGDYIDYTQEQVKVTALPLYQPEAVNAPN